MRPRNLSTVATLLAAAIASNHNILAIAAATAEGETFTIGSSVFEIDLGGGVTATRYAVDLAASAVAAAGTLTLAGNAGNNETVVIGSKTYTFKTALTGAANEVLIGAAATNSIDNLIAAINAAAGAGTLYGTGTTASTQVTAAAGAGDTMVVTAIVKGTGGNSIASTETMVSGSWGGATLASGANPSAANSITGIVTAINGTTSATNLRAVAVAGGVLVIDGTTRGGSACSETLAGSGNAWLAASSFGQGSDTDTPEVALVFNRTCTAAEDTGKLVAFALPFTPTTALVQVRTSAGVIKAWDGKMTVGEGHVLLNSDASADIATNDVVTLIVTG